MAYPVFREDYYIFGLLISMLSLLQDYSHFYKNILYMFFSYSYFIHVQVIYSRLYVCCVMLYLYIHVLCAHKVND